MTTAEIVSALSQFNNTEALEVIEAATRLIREELVVQTACARADEDCRVRQAAQRVADLYAPGGEMTEWTVLDGEDVSDDYLLR